MWELCLGNINPDPPLTRIPPPSAPLPARGTRHRSCSIFGGLGTAATVGNPPIAAPGSSGSPDCHPLAQLPFPALPVPRSLSVHPLTQPVLVPLLTRIPPPSALLPTRGTRRRSRNILGGWETVATMGTHPLPFLALPGLPIATCSPIRSTSARSTFTSCSLPPPSLSSDHHNALRC